MENNLLKSRPTFKKVGMSKPTSIKLNSNQVKSKMSIGRLTDKNYDVRSIGSMNGSGDILIPMDNEEILAMRPNLEKGASSSMRDSLNTPMR